MEPPVNNKRKTNKRFMLLSALGIIMVVDSHCNAPLNLFNTFIPYNSFYMPMFVFISGYFNKVDDKTPLRNYIWRKFKKMIVPYLVISFVAFWLEQLFVCIKTGAPPDISRSKVIYAVKAIYRDGEIAAISSPLWFVPSLFAVQAGYAVIKKKLYSIWDSRLMLLVFTVIHIFTVWFSINIGVGIELLLIFKFFFFLPFFELGTVYRSSLEKRLEKADPIICIISLLLLNMIRILYFSSAEVITFPSLYDLTGFTSPCPATPLISSLIGILFWLKISQLAENAVADNKAVNYISENTFFIMGFHVIFFNILDLILFGINKVNELPGFDTSLFAVTSWYIWDNYSYFTLAYFAVGLLGSLGLKYLYDIATDKIRKCAEKQQKNPAGS